MLQGGLKYMAITPRQLFYRLTLTVEMYWLSHSLDLQEYVNCHPNVPSLLHNLHRIRILLKLPFGC